MATYNFEGVTATPPDPKTGPLNLFIWSMSGVGKTTLASTAPGKKLWIQFDEGGTRSLGERDDVLVIDLSHADYSTFRKLRNTDPLGIDKFLSEHTDFETVVLDSITPMNELSLIAAVQESKNSTIDIPGMHGYAKRNMIMLDVIRKLLAICHKHRRNFIVLAHEGSPQKDEMTARLFVTFIVGGELANLIPLRFDEVWYLYDTGKERKIVIRSNANMRPMKSRIFDTSTIDSFTWTYNPTTRVGSGISTWIEKWKSQQGRKITP